MTPPDELHKTLLTLSSKIGSFETSLSRIENGLTDIGGRIDEVHDAFIEFRANTRVNLDSQLQRLCKLEGESDIQKTWRARLAGIWISVCIFASVFGAGAGLFVRFIK